LPGGPPENPFAFKVSQPRIGEMGVRPELAYFTDTLEWVNNPEYGHAGALCSGTYRHVYEAAFLHD
jgi:hypothetical protein